MSSARNAILGRIRSALETTSDGTTAPGRQSRADLVARTRRHERGLIPDRVNKDQDGLVDLFIAQAEKVNATVARISDESDVPDAVADYLKSENLPAAFQMAPHPELRDLPWDKTPAVTVSEGIADESTVVGLSRARAGVAETGTLIMTSGPESPITLNFLPETHLVVLRRSDIVGAYEDGWNIVRQAQGWAIDGPTHGLQQMPRAVNFVTGPSRTGDIEQTIYLGAHGPRRLHIVLIEDED